MRGDTIRPDRTQTRSNLVSNANQRDCTPSSRRATDPCVCAPREADGSRCSRRAPEHRACAQCSATTVAGQYAGKARVCVPTVNIGLISGGECRWHPPSESCQNVPRPRWEVRAPWGQIGQMPGGGANGAATSWPPLDPGWRLVSTGG